MSWVSPFADCAGYAPAEWIDYRGTRMAARFAALPEEYAHARAHAALLDRSDRGLIRVRGSDRKSWLHNLVTNAVKTLDDNAGNYAFAADVRGRAVFDLNIFCLPDVLWLDVDRASVDAALAHLQRFLISEDADLADLSEQVARLAVSGPDAPRVAQQIGAEQVAALPALGSRQIDGETLLVRHDLAGSSGWELILPRSAAADWWGRLMKAQHVRPAGMLTLDTLRIESGVPWMGRDIDEKVLPPETGQIERGISYHKGCYLGQEVIERMRSHGSMARRLVRLRIDGHADLTLPAPLLQGDAEVGRITSARPHPTQPYSVALGYLRTKLAGGAALRTTGTDCAVHVVDAAV